MSTSTKAIVLSQLKYKDHDLIVKCYTEKQGVVSFLLRGVLKSKKSNIKAAYFLPLSQLQIIYTSKPNRTLQTLKEVKLEYMYSSLHTHVLKSAIVLFLSEVLSSALKEEEENLRLFSYLETALQWLDTNEDYSNFHLLFLLKLTKHLGFYPDTSQIELDFFNLEAGIFESKYDNKNSISDKNLTHLKQLLGTTFDALSDIKYNSKERQSFLTLILLYFELHLGSFKKPKSLQVFNQVFN